MTSETRIAKRSSENTFREREHFDGEVALVFDVRSGVDFEVDPTDTVHIVSFSNGARTHLHRHASRQILIFVHGEGFLEEEGGARWELSAGDVAVCAPGTAHRHGALPESDCVHVAIQSGEAEWLE